MLNGTVLDMANSFRERYREWESGKEPYYKEWSRTLDKAEKLDVVFGFATDFWWVESPPKSAMGPRRTYLLFGFNVVSYAQLKAIGFYLLWFKLQLIWLQPDNPPYVPAQDNPRSNLSAGEGASDSGNSATGVQVEKAYENSPKLGSSNQATKEAAHD